MRHQQTAKQHGRHQRDHVGFKQIGCHPGAIADVIANVIGNHCGVARIILGNPGLHLADQIGANVCTLGENAATEPGKDRNQRRAKCQADQRPDRIMQ